MKDYSEVIHPERRIKPTPKSIANEDGSCVFGNFDKEFEELNFLQIKRPTGAPQFLNRLKLTLWEATEINMEKGVLLLALCDMGWFGKMFHIFYDKRTHNVYCWDTTLPAKKVHVAPNLINGATATVKCKSGFITYENNFQDGKAHVFGKHTGKCNVIIPDQKLTALQSQKRNKTKGELQYDFSLTRLSKPSVASMPFSTTRNRPLYSQKDFFKAEGKLVVNGEEMLSDGETVAIIDDHRGYYPRHAHYDWVTTMGVCPVDGEKKWLAFNLTRNQSVDQDKYNENLLWLENETSILTPVTFTRSVPTDKHTDYSEWKIQDQHGMVDLTYKVYGVNPMVVHALIVKIDYYVTFGELSGLVRGEDGKTYEINGMVGIGEDKSLIF